MGITTQIPAILVGFYLYFGSPQNLDLQLLRLKANAEALWVFGHPWDIHQLVVHLRIWAMAHEYWFSVG